MTPDPLPLGAKEVLTAAEFKPLRTRTVLAVETRASGG